MIVNLQRSVKIDLVSLRTFVETLLREVPEADGRDFSVAFVSDRRIKELNSFFRDKDSTTDVLAFPHEADEFEKAIEGGTPNLGDIVISAEKAERQANENEATLDNEIRQLILHGLLHLCGYDHETDNGEMNRRELALRRKLKI